MRTPSANREKLSRIGAHGEVPTSVSQRMLRFLTALLHRGNNRKAMKIRELELEVEELKGKLRDSEASCMVLEMENIALRATDEPKASPKAFREAEDSEL